MEKKRLELCPLANSVADEGVQPPPSACRPKCRIRKIPPFSTSETVFCTGMDLKMFKAYFQAFI